MFSLRSVCLSVCMSVWKSCERILTKFLGGVGHGPGTNEFNFGDYPDHRLDPGFQSPKSALTGLLKKLPTDFDEILRRAGMWPRDQLITFWWRSASLSESGSPFRIMIQIWEELPRCQHTQNRCPQCSPNEFNFGDDPDHRPDPGVRSPKSGLCWRSAEVCALWALLVTRGVQKVLQLDHIEEWKCYKLHIIFQYNP